jgi:glycerol kinase
VVTGDQSAALFAFGSPQPDTAFVNLGTGAFVQRYLSLADIDAGRLLSSVVYQDSTHRATVIEGTVNGAGSALTQVSRERSISREQLHANSDRWFAETEEPPLFINGIGGLGSPWWTGDFQTRFIANGEPLTDPQAISAVLESIVFMLVVNLQEQNGLLGSASSVVATGGLSRVDGLLQRIADLSGLVVTRAQVSEATSVGLAYLLAELPADWPVEQAEAVFQPTGASRTHSRLQARFDRWLQEMPGGHS